MKHKIILGIALLTLMIVGCDDVDKLLTFYINHQATFKVESSSPLNLPIVLSTPDITTNSSQTFDNNNTSASHVKDIKLEEIKLTITNPSGKTFSFLKSVKLLISTDQNNEIELASLDNIPTTATTITLTPTSEKLDTYIKASSYKLKTSIITREALTEAVDIKADLKFKVTATPR
jgi:hypothetical protein